MTETISAPGALRESFGWPPITVLNFAAGEWQERKRAWVALGLKGEVGRGDNLIGFSDQLKSGQYGKTFNTQYTKKDGTQGGSFWVKEAQEENGATINDTSIFDPVLCELLYTWFAPAGGSVLDPFAGGPTRGIVATKLGLTYQGHELRPEQVEANRECYTALHRADEGVASWVQGDSALTLPLDQNKFDFAMTCPPYFDLEVYSDLPGDLSNLASYDEFLTLYRDILAKAAAKLKDDRFFAIVVGDVRDNGKRGGVYFPLVSDTIRIMAQLGLGYYNRAVLSKPGGSAAFRARRQFEASRKLVTTHEDLLVFVKGDPRKATESCGDCERHIMTQDADQWT